MPRPLDGPPRILNPARPNLIVIVIDGLHAGMVGAYGNGWIQTRRCDQLACESFLFDQAYVDSLALDQAYRALWFGTPATQPNEPCDVSRSFPGLLSSAGWHTALLTDDAEVASFAPPDAFVEQLEIESLGSPDTAEAVSETQIGQLFEAAAQWLETAPRPFALWLHTRAFQGLWDAPTELRNRFAVEDDPETPSFVDVPDLWLPEGYHPDSLLGITHAYAGQVLALDESLGQLLDALDQADLSASTQVTLVSPRGFALGEHLRVGKCDEALFNEVAQLVWLMRFPDGLGKLARTQALAQLVDLPGTLLDWLGLDRRQLGLGHASSLLDVVAGRADELRDRLCLISQHDRALRTSAWYLRVPQTGAPELYTKPSDRWEVNEVGRLLPEIVSGLEAALAEASQGKSPAEWTPLPSELVTQVD